MISAGHSARPDLAASSALDDDPDPRYRSLGRRRGRRLRAAQQARMDGLLPQIRLNPLDRNGIDPRVGCFDGLRSIWLEIGFGGGEHLAAQARLRPDVGFIGVDPYLNGLASFLRLIEVDRLSNVRVVVDDARNLLPSLADASIGRIFVLFPDPWPKLKHRGRRLISEETVRQLVRVLEAGGDLRFATDHRGYAEWARRHLAANRDLRLIDAVTFTDGKVADDWIKTRYQEKAERAGRPVFYFRFARIPGDLAGQSAPVGD